MTKLKAKLRVTSMYLLAFFAMLAAVTLRLVLVPIIGVNTAYLTVFPTIALIAVLAGTGPALFAAAVGIVISESWAFGPVSEYLSAPQLIRGFMAMLTSVAVGYLSSKLKKSTLIAQERAEQSKRSELELLKTTIELRQQQGNLQAAKNAAEAANNEKLNFLATMSHELRTPLTSILGFSELLGEERLSQEEKADILFRVKRNGDLLTRLIDEILDLSKIESGKIEIELMDVNLVALVNDVIGVLSHQAQKKGIKLRSQIIGDVPEKVLTDPTRLRQILSNLIGNAIKFTEKGWVQLTLGVDRDRNKIEFLIEDTGEGVAAENAEKIFEPFVQADSSHTRRFGGTGLGLNLSKKIAQTLGGDVSLVRSTLHQGSIFFATIELRNTVSEGKKIESYTHQDEESSSANNPHLKNVHVLVTDDSTDNQLLVSRLLNIEGANVEVASSGEEALEKTVNKEFDVILMDIQMPNMDGYEVIRRLRSRGYKRPVIALTAYAMKSDLEKSFELGFDDHISKPIKKADLVEAILKFSPEYSGQ